ncbi:hypothetical protein OHB26_20980 [Nocardia sp. NBC_01503]|uniref:WXG100 family type VII secretion target n=1 Tax=Nocardia sp. NBC_01503 TaxID=2975997 RepID=UPI002E7BF3D4|nr:hypothetical protein [Nocardia sp. NBC_01503]WTL29474.1 hypothetical protein OHB26_20980 [Nocardia sp. NBC_01503]
MEPRDDRGYAGMSGGRAAMADRNEVTTASTPVITLIGSLQNPLCDNRAHESGTDRHITWLSPKTAGGASPYMGWADKHSGLVANHTRTASLLPYVQFRRNAPRTGPGGAVVLVDPVVLRSFASSVEEASKSIGAIDLAGKIAAVFDGLTGSQAQWAAHRTGDVVRTPLDKFAADVSAMGTAVQGAAGTYEVTDEDLATGFRKLETEDPCARGRGLK